MLEDGRYWRGAQEDAIMQDEHRFIWDAMLRTIDVDLSGLKVLDVGCNRGGFLRLLADTCGIAQGWGYDRASGAVADATSLSGDRPLTYVMAHSVPEGWTNFDVAFSHEVIYLIDDLEAHADSVFDALLPGGVYFAVEGVHTASPMAAAWHAESAEALQAPAAPRPRRGGSHVPRPGFRGVGRSPAARVCPSDRAHGELPSVVDLLLRLQAALSLRTARRQATPIIEAKGLDALRHTPASQYDSLLHSLKGPTEVRI